MGDSGYAGADDGRGWGMDEREGPGKDAVLIHQLGEAPIWGTLEVGQAPDGGQVAEKEGRKEKKKIASDLALC